MAFRIGYWTLIILVAFGLGYVYLHRLEIPITRSFEELLDAKIISIEKQKNDLGLAVVALDAEQNAEIALRKQASSDNYSSPYRALNKEWYKVKIYFLDILQFLFTYRIIFYVIALLLILYALHQIFWKYYAI